MTADDSLPIARLLPSLASLDQSEIDLIVPLFEPVTLKKGDFFIREGDEVTKVAIVVDGILSRYSAHPKRLKIIDQFLCDNQFFTDREGYISGQRSFTNIEALSSCKLWTIPIDQVVLLKNNYHHFALIIGSISDEKWNHELKLKNMLINEDPLQRIQFFYELYARYLSHIPVGDIQIYLNISHTYFYELLHKLYKKSPFSDIK